MERKVHFRISTIILLISFSFSGYSQQKPDSVKLKQVREQHAFYRKTLQVDSVKAARVAQIQDSYKAGMNQLMAEPGLSEAVKRAKIIALMDEKNQQLRLLLSPVQQAKIIPTTEREQISPARKN